MLKSRPIILVSTLSLTIQGHPRSSILVSIKSSYATSYSSLIVTYHFREIDAFSSKLACFPTPRLFDAPQRRNALRYERNLYTAEKQAYIKLACVADITHLSSFVQPLLPPKLTKSREIPTKFDLTAARVKVIQGHRSWCQSKAYATSYQSLIITLYVSPTIFEILTLKSRKWLIFPTPPLFDAPTRGNPFEFLDETYLAKTRGIWGYRRVAIVGSWGFNPPQFMSTDTHF